jgi:hypothetical protein
MPVEKRLGFARAIEGNVGAFQKRGAHYGKRGGRGLLAALANRYHLPLRGKLGWMTPRAGVKTTPASEMRLPGLPDPKRGPHFF